MGDKFIHLKTPAFRAAESLQTVQSFRFIQADYERYRWSLVRPLRWTLVWLGL